MKKSFYFTVLLASVFLISCGEELGQDNPLSISYHMECAGEKAFYQNSEKDVCSALSDDGINSSCDTDFRKDLFENLCPGKTFPHKVTQPRSQKISRYYEYRDGSCSTGRHYFFYTKSKNLKKELCRVLLDENLNNHCAEETRKRNFEEECR